MDSGVGWGKAEGENRADSLMGKVTGEEEGM